MAAHTFAAADRAPDKVALEVLRAPGEVAERWTHGALADAVRRTAGGLAARGDRPRRPGAAAPRQQRRLPAHLLRGERARRRAGADLGAADGARDRRHPRRPGAPRHLPRARARAAAVSRRAGARPGRDRRPARRTTPLPFAATGPEDPAYMVYTSGTGGRPKGVVHAQRAAWARRMMWDGWYGLTPDDRVLHAGAFNWTYTLGAGLTDPWAIGATALIYAGPPDRGVWPRLAAAHGATIFAAVPGVYRQMLESDANLAAGLRHACATASAPARRCPRRCAPTGRRRPDGRSTRRSACPRSRPTSPSPPAARRCPAASGGRSGAGASPSSPTRAATRPSRAGPTACSRSPAAIPA